MILKPRLKVEALPDHLYKVQGFPSPSVSEIVKPVVPYFNPVNPTPMLFGLSVHEAILYALQDDLQEDSVSDEVLGCVNAARSFLDKHKLTPIVMEHPIGSLDPLCAGRIDIVCEDPKGAIFLPDWKTGLEYDDYRIRLAGYEHCLRSTYGVKSTKRGSVYLKRDGEFVFKEYSDPFDMTVFRACHSIWSWKKLNERKTYE